MSIVPVETATEAAVLLIVDETLLPLVVAAVPDDKACAFKVRNSRNAMVRCSTAFSTILIRICNHKTMIPINKKTLKAGTFNTGSNTTIGVMVVVDSAAVDDIDNDDKESTPKKNKKKNGKK